MCELSLARGMCWFAQKPRSCRAADGLRLQKVLGGHQHQLDGQEKLGQQIVLVACS